MATLRITEAELSRDLQAEERLLSESVALAEARGCTVTLDNSFMKDVDEGIASRSLPWNPPSWE